MTDSAHTRYEDRKTAKNVENGVVWGWLGAT